MSWAIDFFKSSIGKKLIMALTGLFICLFLTIHLLGNLQLLFPDGGHAFNMYAEQMAHNPLIQFIAYGNYAIFLLHIIDGLSLTFQNRSARPERYAVKAGSKNSSFSSRNMALLGTIILVFLVIHMKSFWFESKFGSLPIVEYGGVEYKDLYTIVKAAFAQWWYVALYVISMAAIAFHLVHGFQSAFQTLGLNHAKYNGLIKTVGWAYSILVPLGFAAIPLYFFFFIS